LACQKVKSKVDSIGAVFPPMNHACAGCGISVFSFDFYGMPNDFNLPYYHKATVDELIEHFKGKENQP
jgi:hypothetical protein